MKRSCTLLLLIGAAALLSACNFFSQPADLQTENLQNEVAQTQIAAVRATATVNADQLMITLQSAQTAVGSADMQSTRIASTLIAQGTLIVDASGITAAAPTDAPDSGATPANTRPQIANPLLTPGAPQILGQGSARGDSELVPPTATSQTQSQTVLDPNGANLTNIALTDAIGADDCPINTYTSFTADTTEIYATATAHKLQANSVLHSIWRYEGTQMQDYTWSPGFAIDGACIWFRLPADEVDFTPGNWSVEFTIDGQPAGAPVAFTILNDGSGVPNEIDLNQ